MTSRTISVVILKVFENKMASYTAMHHSFFYTLMFACMPCKVLIVYVKCLCVSVVVFF